MTTAHQPELDFVLAALRRDADALAAQRATAGRVRRWEDVARISLVHDISWWVAKSLPVDGVPDNVRGALQGVARDGAIASLAGARQLAELCRVLDAAGVRSVAYKGPALAVDVHGDLASRRFSDLDLLVAEADRARSLSALHAVGYDSPVGHSEREERVYSRWEGVAQLARGGDLPVELHWRCQGPRYGGPQDPAEIVERARTCDIGGGTVLVPSPEDQLILLALHGVKHVWALLLWMADFAAASSRPDLDWALVDARAKAWNVRRALRVALLVARDLVELDVPLTPLRDAQMDAQAVALANAVAAKLRQLPGAPDVGAESTPRYDFKWLEGARSKARYLALSAMLPTPQERRIARLPDALLPLAYVVRIVRVAGRALGRGE